MNQIRISDITMKQTAEGFSLSFKEKIELSKLLDKLGVSVIELEPIRQAKMDSLRIKSIAMAVKDSILAVPVSLEPSNIDLTWNALKEAARPRMQVAAPVSSVQMEYLFHKKPEVLLPAIRQAIEYCCTLCSDVEFIADDATRSDPAFLYEAVRTAIAAGAKTVTVCDTAGAMLPNEFTAFIRGLYEAVPQLKTVCLGVSCADDLSMADSCAIAAVRYGAGEIKASAHPFNTVSIANIAKVLNAKGSFYNAACAVRTTQIGRITDQIAWLCQSGRGKAAVLSAVQEDSGVFLTAHDDLAAVTKAAAALGYDLSEEDALRVFDSFRVIAAKKPSVSARELDAIIAAAAMQVPSTYQLHSYVITSGNTISATAHLKLTRQETVLEGVSIGDGPIDAAFVALEQITGLHYELDDFQIQSVTQGRSAMGQTVVKLRSGGKVYSGRGISTDIVGASIRAYLNALNKIVYEEESV